VDAVCTRTSVDPSCMPSISTTLPSTVHRSSMQSGRRVGAPAQASTRRANGKAPTRRLTPRRALTLTLTLTLRSRPTTWTWAAWSRWRRCWQTLPAACSPSAMTARSWPAPPRACSCCAATALCASSRAPTTRCGGRAGGCWLRLHCAARSPVPGISGSKGARVQPGFLLAVPCSTCRAQHILAPSTSCLQAALRGHKCSARLERRAGAAATVCSPAGRRRRRRAPAPALLAPCAAA